MTMSSKVEEAATNKNLPIVVAEDQEQENITKVIEDDNNVIAASTDDGALLRWHYRLGHLS